jgi:hypothetical protein
LANAPGFDRQPWRDNQEGDLARYATIDYIGIRGDTAGGGAGSLVRLTDLQHF